MVILLVYKRSDLGYKTTLMNKIRVSLAAIFILLCSGLQAQTTDTVRHNAEDSASVLKAVVDTVVNQIAAPVKRTPIDLRDAIVPTACIAYGIIALYPGALNTFNYTVKDELYDDRPTHRKGSITIHSLPR